jgi:hypothetical protein
MTTPRQAAGRKTVARPAIPPADYHDEISDKNFQKIKDAVADLNSPDHKRHIVTGIDLGD